MVEELTLQRETSELTWDNWEGDGDSPELEDNNQQERDILPQCKPKLEPSASYSVLPTNEIKLRRDSMINEIKEELNISDCEASALLIYKNWDKLKLMEAFLKDPEQLRKEAGIESLSSQTQTDLSSIVKMSDETPKSEDNMVQCSTAFCGKVELKDSYTLHCGHRFCNVCWKSYLTSEITTGKGGIAACCPGWMCTKNHQHKEWNCKCRVPVPEEVFKKFLSEEHMQKYTKWLLSSFVDGSKNTKWCPAPGCENVIEYPAGVARDVICNCGYSFCFSCGNVAHRPMPCYLTKKWLLKASSDEWTIEYLKARTKQCPKCKIPIEKDRFCNHMVCSQCKNEFCWLCLGVWSKHNDYYKCKQYATDVAAGKVTEREKSQAASQQLIQKYNAYYSHFEHQRHGVLEAKKFIHKFDTDWASTVKISTLRFYYLKDAAINIKKARHVLQWSYALAYYIKSGIKKDAFENFQAMVANHTEHLQELLIKFTDLKDLLDNNQEISRRSKIIKSAFGHLMDCLDDDETLYANILDDADTEMNEWGCSACTKVNPLSVKSCKSCYACRQHGEIDCKICHRVPD